MMLFDDVKKAVDRFSPEELRQLREHIENQEQTFKLQPVTTACQVILLIQVATNCLTDEVGFGDVTRFGAGKLVEPLCHLRCHGETAADGFSGHTTST
ncbi:MAG: hypothetical protein D6698_02970 [Gammaproteobacteria bacterium]|nr:MAG: hypothetical protein D6698_02970 [Gammaproteobacteria bacterium]